MNPAIRLTALLLVLGFHGTALAERSFSSLEERMTGEEFRESGLHKLTPEELAALNRWIGQRSLAEHEYVPETRQPDSARAVPEDRRGLREQSGRREPIESNIVGKFTGWTGRETFELANGMVWRQLGTDTFYVPEMEDPEVVIRPGFMGSWNLQVIGYSRRTRVERVR